MRPFPLLLRRRVFWLYAMSVCLALTACSFLAVLALVDAPIWKIASKAINPPEGKPSEWDAVAYQGYYGAWAQSASSLLAGFLALIGGFAAFVGARYQGQRSFDAAIALIVAEDARREIERSAQAGALAVTLVEEYRYLGTCYRAAIVTHRARVQGERHDHTWASLGADPLPAPSTFTLTWEQTSMLGAGGAEAIAKVRGDYNFLMEAQENLQRNCKPLFELPYNPHDPIVADHLSNRADASRIWRGAIIGAIRNLDQILKWLEIEKAAAVEISRRLHTQTLERLHKPPLR